MEGVEVSGDGLKLNLGCGGQIASGWINVDRYDDALDAPNYLHHDLRRPLPWPDGAARWVVLHHVLDLFDAPDLRKLLLEVHRVLADDGVVRVSSVDYDRGLGKLVFANEIDTWLDSLEVPKMESTAARIDWWIAGGGSRKTMLLAPALLRRWLAETGFSESCVTLYGCSNYAHSAITLLDSRADESWFVEAIK